MCYQAYLPESATRSIVDEVYQSLRLDGCARHILHMMRTKLYCPFSNRPSGFAVLYHISDRCRTDHSDWVLQEVVLQLPTRHKDPKDQLLPMWIPVLGHGQYLTNEIHQSLNMIFFAFFLAFNNHRNNAVENRGRGH